MLAARPTVISSIMGVFEPEYVRRLAEAGIAWFACATTLEEALAAQEAGAAAVVAQGMEAGGHRGSFRPEDAEATQVGLFALLPRLVDHLRVPVVAAGGIADAEGLRRAQTAGAAGVVMGTRFLATPEADIHPGYAERLVAAGPDDTVRTFLFDGGWPGAAHRVLRNSTYRAWEAAGSPEPGERPNEGEVVAETDGVPIARYAADEPRRSTTGDIEAMCLYAGRGVGLITAVEPAAEIVARMVA
jgi:nitronate monooxygenase